MVKVSTKQSHVKRCCYFDYVLFLEDFSRAVCNFFLTAHHPYFADLSLGKTVYQCLFCAVKSHFLISVLSLYIFIIFCFESSIYTNEELV